MDINREEILKEATSRYYTDPDFNVLVENAIMLTLAQPETIIPGMHERVRATARWGAVFALILQEKASSLSPAPLTLREPDFFPPLSTPGED